MQPDQDNAEENQSVPELSSAVTPSTKCNAPRNSFKRKKTLSPSDQVLVDIGKKLAEKREEDRFDVFGRNVAQKLRTLSNDQRIYAEKVINEALFEAELGCLTRNASVNPDVIEFVVN